MKYLMIFIFLTTMISCQQQNKMHTIWQSNCANDYTIHFPNADTWNGAYLSGKETELKSNAIYFKAFANKVQKKDTLISFQLSNFTFYRSPDFSEAYQDQELALLLPHHLEGSWDTNRTSNPLRIVKQSSFSNFQTCIFKKQ